MSDTPVQKRKVHEGEVLGPSGLRGPSLPDLPPRSPFGIPLLARMKFEAEARAFRAYSDLRRAQRESFDLDTALIGAAQDRLAAEERLALALSRQQHLPKILDAHEAVLLAELDSLFSGVAAAKAAGRERAEDHEFERRIRKAELEAQALEAEARVAALKNPPQTKAEAEPELSRAQKIARAIAQVKKDGAELKASFIEDAGGEENLTEEDQAHLATVELWIEDQIRSIMENF